MRCSRLLAAALLTAPLITCAVAAPGSLSAADLSGRWAVRDGKIAYEVTHVLHSALGRSTSVKGTLNCETQPCRFRFRVPVASFDSHDADRDRDMQVVVNASRFPLAEVTGSGRLVSDEEAVVEGSITLAGATVALPPTRFRVERGWWSLKVQGRFTLALDALGIQRPALMGIPIADEVLIYVDLELGSA